MILELGTEQGIAGNKDRNKQFQESINQNWVSGTQDGDISVGQKQRMYKLGLHNIHHFFSFSTDSSNGSATEESKLMINVHGGLLTCRNAPDCRSTSRNVEYKINYTESHVVRRIIDDDYAAKTYRMTGVFETQGNLESSDRWIEYATVTWDDEYIQEQEKTVSKCLYLYVLK